MRVREGACVSVKVPLWVKAADNRGKKAKRKREREHTPVQVALKFHHPPVKKEVERIVLWLNKLKLVILKSNSLKTRLPR